MKLNTKPFYYLVCNEERLCMEAKSLVEQSQRKIYKVYNSIKQFSSYSINNNWY